MSRWKVPEHFKVIIGGNTYIDCPTIIDYKGERVFELRRSDADGYLGINFDVYAANRSKVATVRNGQFVGPRPEGFKIEASHDHYSLLEEATGRSVCELKLREKAPGDAEIEAAAMMYMPDGVVLRFTPTETNLPGVAIKGCTFQACQAAIKVG